MIVVKLGGSLYNTPELAHWLNALAGYSQQQDIVIVPGGGPFADQVRTAQDLYQFNDSTAHHMALLAMKQFGLMMIDLEEACQPFDVNSPNHLSVWLPDDDLLNEATLQHSWDISSDSLALWLANKLHATQLILVKHCQPSSSSIKDLTTQQVIDKGFATLFKRHPLASSIIHYQSYHDLNAKTALTLS